VVRNPRYATAIGLLVEARTQRLRGASRAADRLFQTDAQTDEGMVRWQLLMRGQPARKSPGAGNAKRDRSALLALRVSNHAVHTWQEKHMNFEMETETRGPIIKVSASAAPAAMRSNT
jgi:hypothetical protein